MIRRYAILPLLVLASVTHAQATPLDNLSAAGRQAVNGIQGFLSIRDRNFNNVKA